MTKDAVRAYYASFSEREWQRLTNPDDGTVEFALTKQLLAIYTSAVRARAGSRWWASPLYDLAGRAWLPGRTG